MATKLAAAMYCMGTTGVSKKKTSRAGASAELLGFHSEPVPLEPIAQWQCFVWYTQQWMWSLQTHWLGT